MVAVGDSESDAEDETVCDSDSVAVHDGDRDQELLSDALSDRDAVWLCERDVEEERDEP